MSRYATTRLPRLSTTVLAELLRPVIEAEHGYRALATRSGVASRRIYAIVSGESAWVSFDTADRLITLGLGDPSLWRTVPELANTIESEDAAA